MMFKGDFNMRETYEVPAMEVVVFEAEDIITDSMGELQGDL